MADEVVTLRDINWRETFPFTHLFRAFRVAIHPSKLVIGLVLLALLWCGGLVLDSIWPGKYQVTTEEHARLWLAENTPELHSMPPEADREAMAAAMPEEYRAVFRRAAARSAYLAGLPEFHPGIFRTFFDYEVAQANTLLMGGAWPFRSTWRFIAIGPMWLWSNHWLFALIYTAWFLLVWAVLGGAISRIAAVHVARDEKISVRHSLTFSVGKVLSFIFAPVIPVFIIFGIGIVISITATILLHIPYVGPIITGLFFFLALIGGFVITLLILGTIGGFNLMYPTIAVEGSDSFDAISRSFSYVFARPWRMLLYTIVAVIYGAICYLFVRFFVWMMLEATWFFMAWLLGGHHVNSPADVWPRIWSEPIDPLAKMRYSPDYEHLKGTEAAAAGLIVWWVYIVIGLVGAFAVSFYFSANTIIYYLMRREVDATDLDDVYVEETDEQPEDVEETTGPTAGEATVTTTTVITATETAPESAPSPTPPPPEGGESTG